MKFKISTAGFNYTPSWAKHLENLGITFLSKKTEDGVEYAEMQKPGEAVIYTLEDLKTLQEQYTTPGDSLIIDFREQTITLYDTWVE